jgi:hypothetical protein
VVLHAAQKLEEGGISDVDVAVETDPIEIIKTVRPAWARSGLTPILIWPYDIGGTLTVFLASADGSEGVQLDMLFDREGMGKYGVRSQGLVDSAIVGPIPVVNEPARLTYLWRKRVVKGHDRVLDALRAEAATIPEEDLVRASNQLTGSADTAHELLGRTEKRSRNGETHPVTRLRRLTERILHPIGYWAHVNDQTIADELASRLSGYLVVVRTGPIPSFPGQIWWYFRRVLPTTLRPGVFLSHGSRPTWGPAPSVVLDPSTIDDAASLLISTMGETVPG